MVVQIFFSPQVKLGVIISNKLISNKLVYSNWLKTCQTTQNLGL